MCFNNRAALLESLPDERLTASDSYSQNHLPPRSRLSTVTEGYLQDAWAVIADDPQPWIQADFEDIIQIEQVELRPRSEHEQWVTSFKLAVSTDGSTFDFLLAQNGEERVFKGPTGMSDFVTKTFNSTRARYIRLYPLTFHVHASLKWEVYGCTDGMFA